jgi:predicted phage tail protein
MQQTVRLLDDLGARYGSEHVYFNLRSPAEAIKLLCINHPALQKELTEAHQHGVGYTLVQAGTFLGYEDLQLPLGKNDLVLAPVIAGSGSGGSTGTILVGVGLVAASIIFAPAGAGFLAAGLGVGSSTTATFSLAAGAYIASTTSVLSAGLSVALGSIGASLILGGTAQLLSPQPQVPTLNNRTAPGENTNASGPQGVSRATSGQQSYAFAGPANTVGVGATVPLVYGKLLIGSHLLSSRVRVADDSNPTGEFFGITGPSSITVNGKKPGNRFQALNGLRTRKWDANVRPSSGSERLSPNQNINFNDKSKQNFDDIKNYEDGDNERENFQILFELDRGLFNVIGGQNVPAFVTYEITVTKNNYSGKSPVFANVRATVQGLLKSTDTYRFAHAITYGHSGEEENDTTIELGVRIIDTDADDSGRLVIKGVGYNYFHGDNNTEDLAEV